MGQTNVASGSPAAKKLQSVALWNESLRSAVFSGAMTGPAPKQASAEAKSRGQTSEGYPIVRITDLNKGKGERITVDLYDTPSGIPVMGDNELDGNEMSLTSDTDELKINQARQGINPGGKMTQQRTEHELFKLARSKLAGFFYRYQDQVPLIHAAGARGYEDNRDWVIPLQDDPRFPDVMVNPVKAPTANRRFFAGDGTSVANLDATDILALEDLDRISLALEELVFPMQPVRLEGDPMGAYKRMYCLYVTPRVWHYIETKATGVNWRNFLAQALTRKGDMKSHPLFAGAGVDCGMWNGLLVKKMFRPIRFPAGKTVREVDANGVEQDIVAAVDTDRSILLGAQAIATAYGMHQNSEWHYNWETENKDYSNVKKIAAGVINGCSKVRFKGSDGEVTDWGCLTIDSHAPKAA
jgi:N4-gp56 family major capsid protein